MVRAGHSRGLVGRLGSEKKGPWVTVKVIGSGVRALESVVSTLGRRQACRIRSSGRWGEEEWVGTQGQTLPWR